ncbi:hypothetical protein RF55_14685, partial [Lasius niger]
MMERTPPGEWMEEKDGGEEAVKREEDGALIAILREIKEEMADMRKEVREMKEKWNNLENKWTIRERSMEERMDGLEERLSKIEQKGSNREEEEEERTEELVGKMIEKVKKKERMIESQAPSNIMETREEVRKIKKAMEDRERKERRNNLIIKGLKKEKKNIYETTREFLEDQEEKRSERLEDEEKKRKKKRKEKRKEEKGLSRGIRGRVKIVFWNVAGLKRKDREFWNFIESFDIIGLSETWIEERGWEIIKRSLSKRFSWKCQYAIREKKKGRAKGGIITGIRKGLDEISGEEVIDVNGIQERRLRIEGRTWKIIMLYNDGKMKDKRKELEGKGAWDRIEKLTVGKRVESDHQPLEVEVRGEFRRETGRAQEVIKEIVQWNEESIEKYKKKEREITIEGKKVEEVWKSLKAGIEECIVRKRIRLRRKKIGEKDWWDAECKRRKKQVKKAYSRWREGKEEKGRYQLLKREVRELCRKKEGRKEKLEEEENINMGDWKNHFQHLLEESEKDNREDAEKSLDGDQEEELRNEEIKKQMKKMKRKKAAGADGIGSEVKIHSEGQIREKLKELF